MKFMSKLHLSCKLSLLRMRLAVVLLLFLLTLTFTSDVRANITHPDEVLALKDVKMSLYDPMKNLSNWDKGDPCNDNWTGVFCYNQTLDDGYLHLLKLQLMNMKLSGNLSPKLGKLSRLSILNFMWNEIGGNIPEEIGNLKNLKLLLLSGNQLTGPLPDELGNLPNITRMQINLNKISGTLPKSFANLNKLEHFHLNNNSISGEIPSELSRLPSLVHFVLDNNNLSGSLPEELSMMPMLKILQLDNNNFIGTDIPASYGNMTKLLKLSLRNCSLQGSIPDFSKIANLSYIDLSMNQLNGHIPSEKLSDKMITIILSHNYLTGSIPASFSTLPHLQKLSLDNNKLSGNIPSTLWQSRKFTDREKLILDFGYNKLTEIAGSSSLPKNVTLLLEGNPLCSNKNIAELYCGSPSPNDMNMTNDTFPCSYLGCPYLYEYAPKALTPPCYCALPLIVSFRLEGPGFTYFFPYQIRFENFLAYALGLDRDQLSLSYTVWQEGPRLFIKLKLFPVYNNATNSQIFSMSEVQRIWSMFSEWKIPNDDIFGPYELLNFTLLDPYMAAEIDRIQSSSGLSKVELSAIIVGTFVVAFISFLIVNKHLRKYIRTLKRHQSSIKVKGVKGFSYKEMALATNNFSSCFEVGEGGYGKVYKGVLANGEVVAIKRAKMGSLQGNKEFCTEIELLSRLHHRHLVSLVGYCDDKGEQMLVYEFMPNGTLSDHLSVFKSKQPLSFTTRLRIALGSARGILYLHTEADPPIFHRDIKATNILLDSKFIAKVADFGLSKLAPEPDIDGTVPPHRSTVVKGTPGYLDPEYFITRMYTDKSDVYGLGIVFLELLTSMQPISLGKNIVREVNIAYKSGNIISVVDERMGTYSHEFAERFAVLALRCCHDETTARPSMAEVVRDLEAIIMQTTPDSDVILTMESSFNTSTKRGSTTSSSASSMKIPSSRSVHLSGCDSVSRTLVSYVDPR